MAHSSAQTNTNTNANSIINNSNSKFGQTPIILQRNASQPIDIMAPTQNNGAFQKPSAPTVAQQLAFNKIDKKKTSRRFDKNIAFSTPVDDPVMDDEFDFEKNLALFDKQAIWDKIDANQKPDLVRMENKSVHTLHSFCFNYNTLLLSIAGASNGSW